MNRIVNRPRKPTCQLDATFSKRSFLVTIFILYAIITPRPVSAEAGAGKVFIPLITNNAPAWQLNAQEQALEALFRSDPEQQRVAPVLNVTLSQVARMRAADMAARDYFDHKNPEGQMPNYLVESAGYVLPSYYPDNGNSVESIGLNYTTAAEAWSEWADSHAHRSHVLGEEDFYADQNEYGIGYVESASGRYWVLITAQEGP